MSLNGVIYRNRRYDFNPKRCFRCSLYGYSSAFCNRKLFCAFCGSNNFLAECPTNQNKGVPIFRHCRGEHVSCTSKCNYFKSAKTVENKKQLGKITLKESIKLYNLLNNKIIPKFVHEGTSNNEIMSKNNIKQSKYFRTYYMIIYI